MWGYESFAQRVTISGYVTDKTSGESLSGATIFSALTRAGTLSNSYGFFSLRVATPTLVRFSYVGYEPITLTITATQDTVVQIRLAPIATQMSPVSVLARKVDPAHDQPIGLLSIPIQQLKAVPALLGETDVIKALALTPGVTTGNEGTTGLLVRGGTPDQNLILLDDATVYNVAHLFGFVSTFNPDAIRKVDLYKGGFPARYGGRLSSVVDLAMKEGNNRQHRREVSIGLVSSRILWEGPLSTKHYGRSSYFISARSSYFTLFLLPNLITFWASQGGQYFNYWLYDINAKANHQFRDGSRLFVSLYNGNDTWTAQEGTRNDRSRFNLNWGNTTASVRYTRALAKHLFLRSTLTYSYYHYRLGTKALTKEDDGWQTLQRFRVSSTIQDITAKVALEYSPWTTHKLQGGLEAIRHRFHPTRLSTSYQLNSDTLARINAAVPATELAAYLEDNLSLTPWLKSNIGIRAVNYTVGSKTYTYTEPRFSLNVIPSQRWSLKLGYSRMHQFVHLLTSNGIGLPNDVWVPSTPNVPPQGSTQLSAGVTYVPTNKALTITLEAYHKTLNGLIDYQTGTGFMSNFNQSWETTVERDGIGDSKGLELMLHKTQGRLQGWASYTWAHHQRRFATIDQNRWYDANFDRRHVFSTTGQYAISDHISASATWVYQSGQPTTIPVAIQENLGQEATAYPLLIYRERNNFRMPAYHRLDLAITLKHLTRKRRRNAQWSLGIYNAYNRANPFYLDFEKKNIYSGRVDTIGFDYKVVRKAVFPVLPYVSYSLELR